MSSAAKKLLQIQPSATDAAVYADDVFSTYLYEGTGLPHTIANGINLGSLNVNAFGYGDHGTSRTIVLNHLVQGDVVVVFNTGAATGATVTVGGSSATVLEEDYTSPTYGYEHSTFAYTVASGDPATMDVVITNNTYGGLVLVIKGGATVTLQAGGSANSANTITEPDFSTTGYGLILTSDRDPSSTSLTTTDADLTNIIIDNSPSFFVHSCWEMDSGNGGTISGFNSGSNYEQVHVVLKVEGAGTTAFGNTEVDGGLVWTKARQNTSGGGTIHALIDSERGTNKWLASDTRAETTNANLITAFNSNGYTVGTGGPYWTNDNGYDYVSWTFRKQPGFFDVVTYTGDGNSSTGISHNLDSEPKMMIIKRTNTTGDWAVYHKDIASNPVGWKLKLNNSSARYYSGSSYFPTVPTSSVFYPGSDSDVNGSGQTYVAYLFAHNDQRFGKNSDESIIYCGTYEGNGGTKEITLGWEPQWILSKNIDDGGNNWMMCDIMRGAPVSDDTRFLEANTGDAEAVGGGVGNKKWWPTATGFTVSVGGGGANDPNENGETYIYVAIRRPHKPASEFAATDLFDVFKYTDNTLDQSTNPILLTSDGQTNGPSVLTDMWWHRLRSTGISDSFCFQSRLTGIGNGLVTQSTGAEPQGDAGELKGFDQMTGVEVGPNGTFYYSSSGAGNRTHISYYLRRAPGFFDVVAYTGQSAEMSVSHNLGVTPELIIQKCRTQGSGYNWNSWYTGLTNSQYINLNTTAAPASSSNLWGTNSTVATDSVFRVGSATTGVNGGSSNTHIAYLFATAEGISKVGTYTGSGSTQTINCGFSNGARFVLIKCISGSSNWFVWDSERGITSGLDPYIIVNQTAAETTNSPVDVNPASSGFEVFGNDSDSNRNNETYLFLAIA